VLILAKRGHTSGDTRHAAALIKKHGFNLGLQMMPGLVGDTREKSIKTALGFKKMNPYCVRVYPTLVIENTELCELYRQGEYTPLTLTEARDLCADIYEILGDKIIRMGLLMTDDVRKSIVAGPSHPAFGELVKSEVFYRRLKKKAGESEARVFVNPKDISLFIGQGKENIKRLPKLKFMQDCTVKRGEFKLEIL